MKQTFRLEGLGCASCAAKMERSIAALDGVTDASVSFMTAKLVIEAEEDKMPGIVEAAKSIVKRIERQVVLKKA